MDQTLIARAKAERKARMASTPQGAQAERIYNTVMAQHHQRMAASKPQPRHLHVVAHAGATAEPKPYRHMVTEDDINRAIAAYHAREKAEAQVRERVEANAEIMRAFNAKGRQPAAEPQTLDEAQAAIMAQFTAPKPAALAIRSIKE